MKVPAILAAYAALGPVAHAPRKAPPANGMKKTPVESDSMASSDAPHAYTGGVPYSPDRKLGPRGVVRKQDVIRRGKHGEVGVSEEFRKTVYERRATRSGLKS